jgi:hypothetical protein
VLVVLLFRVSDEEAAEFPTQAAAVLAPLAARPGYRSSQLGRSVDDPGTWVLLLDWSGVGDYRRALSQYDVKVATAPLLSRALQLPTAFEVLRTEGPDGITTATSDRSAEAG